MISVRYQGRLGNNLFQYCFGRILSEETGLALSVGQIPDFYNTKKIDGKKVTGEPKILSGHEVDLEDIIKNYNNSPIHLNGYYFRYEYYKPYKKQIKEDWLAMSNKVRVENTKDAVVHIRRGDFVSHGYTLTADSYHRMINSLDFEDLYIVTDDPSDSFIKNFDVYNPKIISSSQSSDFMFLMSFDKIIISQSTFSWWAAYLSDASNIIAPRTKNGVWGSDTRPDVNLTVDDEIRYTYIDCEAE